MTELTTAEERFLAESKALADWIVSHSEGGDESGLKLQAQCSNAQRDMYQDAERRAGEAEAHILDIDAHCTPSGTLDGESVTLYTLTAGALHRALGCVGHSSKKCGKVGCDDIERGLMGRLAAMENLREAAQAEAAKLREALERIAELAGSKYAESAGVRLDAAGDVARAAIAKAEAPGDSGPRKEG